MPMNYEDHYTRDPAENYQRYFVPAIGRPSAAEGAYGSLKTALIRYAAGMASVLAAEGIRVNTVSPGTIDIEDGFWGGISRENPEFFAQVEGWTPMGRMGSPTRSRGRSRSSRAPPRASSRGPTCWWTEG